MRRQILWSALAVAAVTLSAGLAAGAVIRQELVHRNEVELTRQAQATARLLETGIREAIQSGNAGESPLRILEITRRIGGHDYVEARFEGPLVERAVDIPLGETPLLDALGPSPPLDRIVTTEVAGKPVIAAVRAIRLGPRREGIVAIGRTEPLLGSNILARPLLFSLGIGAIVAVGLAAFVAGRVGKRLEALQSATESIAGGDFNARAPEAGSDDVARLGIAFNKMAEQLHEARRRERDFLMSVGHDLRTPLTTIRGYAEALDAGHIDSNDLPRVAGVLHRQTDRLSRLIDDLTLLARLEAREFTLRPEPVDLTAHIKELAEHHRIRADEMWVRFDLELEDVGVVEVDPDRIGQIVGNLMGNALRYTPEGGTVTLGLRAADDVVTLVVADTGPGIDPEDLPHVFERLYVAQRYRAVRPEGSGLGLSIVKELTTALGGEVSVSSVLGKGTAVTVILPAARSRGE